MTAAASAEAAVAAAASPGPVDAIVDTLAPARIETNLDRDVFAPDAGEPQVRRTTRRLDDLNVPRSLASEACSFIPGATLAIDDGHMVSPL